MNVTEESRESGQSDGDATVFVEAAESLAATVDRALRLNNGARRVVVTGPRPGGDTLPDVRRWCESVGEWTHEREPYVRNESLRCTIGGGGRTISVTRAAPWVGDRASPTDAVGGMRVLRHVVRKWGVMVKGTPGHVGIAMLRSRGLPDPLSGDVQHLLRSTSGQGRFELFDRARRSVRVLHKVDARFQYGAIAAAIEIPFGDPVPVVGDPDPYLRGWVDVDFAAPREWAHVGLLGVFDSESGTWAYPRKGRTWCALSEVQLARRNGWRVKILGGIVWPKHGRGTLNSWAAFVHRERERVAGLPIPQGQRDAARHGLRAIVLQGVGMLHGSDSITQHVADDASQVPESAVDIVRDADGRWRYTTSDPSFRAVDAHPEYTTQMYALARVRLAVQLLAQRPGDLVACALDAFYTAGKPVDLAEDDGKPGRFIASGTFGAVGPLLTLNDLYNQTREQE